MADEARETFIAAKRSQNFDIADQMAAK